GLYPDVSIYTEHLRALEGFCKENPDSAAARFVLAYMYLTQGHAAAAIEQLKHVVALQPKDTVSANLIKQLQGNNPAAGLAARRPGKPAGAVVRPFGREDGGQGRTIRGDLGCAAGRGYHGHAGVPGGGEV